MLDVQNSGGARVLRRTRRTDDRNASLPLAKGIVWLLAILSSWLIALALVLLAIQLVP